MRPQNKKSQNQFEKIIHATVQAGFILLLAACAGQNSDPLKDYKDVKGVPLTQIKSDSQTVPVSPFRIEVKDSAQKNSVSMTEGAAKTFTIVVIPQTLQTGAITGSTLGFLDFPFINNKPEIKKISAFEYLISWTPQQGTIAQGELDKDVGLELLARPTDAGLAGLGSTKIITLKVRKISGAPEIVKIEGLPAIAPEGTVVDFTIDVEDPTYTNQARPILITPRLSDSNTEAYLADAAGILAENKKLKAQEQNPYHYPGTKRFRFFYTLDLTRLPVDYDRNAKLDANAGKVNVCFNMNVLSSTRVSLALANGKQVDQQSSTDIQKCVMSYYTAQPAQFEWIEKGTKTAIAGQKNTYEFIVSTYNNFSDIKILKPDDQIAGLKGEKSLNCEPFDSKEPSKKLKCVLSWTPESVCGKAKAKFSKKPISVVTKIKATTYLTTTTKEFTEYVSIDVSDTEERCKSAQAAAAAEKIKKDTLFDSKFEEKN